ncbi:hypothetical protein RhiirC2_793735 [Rhizophagus irregularis]|uniref:Uncharacterized protein n=1 Tax=Rhizophagus irregularis TaxID=588596 RepID=A0A2N1MEV4_9GLOM|nr:hypothetical protein RhiirC2_793735 [Rhizophagus irregularis]
MGYKGGHLPGPGFRLGYKDKSGRYAIFAKYNTLILNEKSKVQYTILQNDDLYDGSDQAEGYFKSMNEMSWVLFQKMVLQILLVQIDCAIILNANGELTDSIRHEYNQVSNFNKWINFSFDELNAHIKNKKVIKQSNYSSTTKGRTLLKEVEEHGIKVGCWTVIDIW